MAPDGHFLYFAYGSNMLTARLRARCSTARPLVRAVASNVSLSFCKRGHDGSGKATFVDPGSSADVVHGVLYAVANAERARLDEEEGPGYEPISKVVVAADGREVRAHTYVARVEARDERLVPYDWYHALVLAGTLEHDLPQTHLDIVRAVTVCADPEPDRERRQVALRLLEAAGYSSLLP